MNIDCSTNSSHSSSSSSSSSSGISLSNNSTQVNNLSQQQQQQQHANANNSNNNNNNNSNAKNKKLFPKKLWDLINNEKYYFCLRWSEDGQLVYLNRDEFEDSYLKTAENQFHTQKAISFVRQMNMYGFRKVDDCYYENDNFKRDCEHLLKNMIRKHPNKNQMRHTVHHQHQHHLLTDDLLVPKQLQFMRSHNSATTTATTLSIATNRPSNSVSSLFDQSTMISAASESPPLTSTTSTPSTISGASNNQQPHLGGTDQAADLRSFYALLSSLSHNFYNQQPTYQSEPLFADSKPAAAAPFPASLQQQIYQSLLAQQQADSGQHLQLDPSTRSQTTITTTKDLFAAQTGVVSPQMQMSKWTSTNPLASSQSLLDRATSLLAANSKSTNNQNNTANDLSLKTNATRNNNYRHFTTDDPRSLSPGDSNSSSSLVQQPLPLARRRQESGRPVRSFKRSVDSILNTNSTDYRANNQQLDSPANNKRLKLEFYQQQQQQQQIDSRAGTKQRPPTRKRLAPVSGGVNELAKNLVSEIALSRDAHLDSNTLIEASKYTVGFVQTLFDTALVIARHSNGLNLSDYMLTTTTSAPATNTAASCQSPPLIESHRVDHADHDEDDDGLEDEDDEEIDPYGGHHDDGTTAGADFERSNISVSDLTSALKLLPSKLLKIWQ